MEILGTLSIHPIYVPFDVHRVGRCILSGSYWPRSEVRDGKHYYGWWTRLCRLYHLRYPAWLSYQ